MQLNRQNQHHTNATYQKVLLQIQSEVTSPDPNPMEALVEMKNVLGIQLSQQQIAHFLTHNFSSLVKLAGRDEKEVKDGDYYKKTFYSLYQKLNDQKYANVNRVYSEKVYRDLFKVVRETNTGNMNDQHREIMKTYLDKNKGTIEHLNEVQLKNLCTRIQRKFKRVLSNARLELYGKEGLERERRIKFDKDSAVGE